MQRGELGRSRVRDGEAANCRPAVFGSKPPEQDHPMPRLTLASAQFGRSAIAGLIVAATAAISGVSPAEAQSGASDYAALVAAPDRSDADRQADKRRDPAPFLAFVGLRPGMKVLDMGAGAGYSTELDARAVAPNGMVYGQNPADFFERAKAAWAARLATPPMKNVTALSRAYDDPLPEDVHDLDAITFLFAYHDVTYMEVDRAKMDRRMFDALRPGGVLVIADHAAKEGAEIAVGKTLHRIDKAIVLREIEAAGFRLIGEGDFWRHPDDTRDFSTNRPPSPVDEFVLKFQKPM
jgi:predicted methyltransferase